MAADRRCKFNANPPGTQRFLHVKPTHIDAILLISFGVSWHFRDDSYEDSAHEAENRGNFHEKPKLGAHPLQHATAILTQPRVPLPKNMHFA